MKESYAEGLANRSDSESGANGRKVMGEAMTGACTGRVLSRENSAFGGPTLLSEAEGNTGMRKMASACLPLRGRRPLACTETLCARTGRACILPLKMEKRNVP